ncbi:hypothetical protein [Pseudomonas sp.]|uniref:DUF7693 family protein n=1 Tax=Pseudomonas sp. TaxID=306 RepID=UPI0028AE2B20|nr:hypothetical protein [Pseudomonas sp.]
MYQRLRDAALGIRTLHVLTRCTEGEVRLEIEGWLLTVRLDREGLAGCLACRTASGASASLEDDWPRYGTDPTDLLSLWERQRLERLLSIA